MGTLRRSADQPLADIRLTFGVLDLRRHEEVGVPERCVPGDLDCRSPGLVPGMSSPVRHYTFELNATFFFHDAW